MPGLDPLPPHPLVLGLAARLIGEQDVGTAYSIAHKAAQGPGDTAKRTRLGFALATEAKVTDAAGRVQQLLDAPTRAQLTKLRGYFAGTVHNTDGDDGWLVVFLDDLADTYVLVPVPKIVLVDRVEDPHAAFGKVDVLWLYQDAQVVSGRSTESIKGRFTSGTFMRAGEFRSSMGGGALGAQDALLTMSSPCCCRRYSP